MKKMLMKFADSLLSKEQLKEIKGGGDTYGGIYSPGGGGSGTIYCGCPGGGTITTGGQSTSSDIIMLCGGRAPYWCVSVG